MNKQQPMWLRWMLCVWPAVLAAALYYILPHCPSFTEYAISRGLFRVVAFPLEWLLSILPFSVTECAVVLGVPALVGLAGWWLWRFIRRPHKKQRLEQAARRLLACLSAALLIFMIMDGAHFSRQPLETLLDLPDNTYTADDLYTVTVDVARQASAARALLPEDENGCVRLSAPLQDILLAANDVYAPLRETYPFLRTGTWRVKPVALSRAWSYTGYTGVYCPWLGEASVNVDVPPCDLGHTAAHELAHTMGFAKEDECNFLAWLACAEGGQPDYAYSGHLAAFIYCSGALYKADKRLFTQAYAFCSDGMRRDLAARRDYWQSFTGRVMTTSQQVNDAFIKANGVEEGVLSYDAMVGCMLRYYDKQNRLK